MSVVTFLAAVALAAADPCATPPDSASCMSTPGFCFDLEIDGADVVPLDDVARTASFEGIGATPVCWTLRAPVTGAMSAEVKPNARTANHLGALREGVEVVVTPLEGQEVPTRKGIRTDPTVRIGGVAMQTVVDVVALDALPVGHYVATFRVLGERGWDRKAVWLEVAREK